MRIMLNPIMLGLLIAALPGPAQSSDTDPTTASASDSSRRLTRKHALSEAAPRYAPASNETVTGNQPPKHSINSSASIDIPGGVVIFVTTGGEYGATNNRFLNLSTDDASHGIVSMDTGSLATLRNSTVSTLGTSSHGVLAMQSGKIVLDHGLLTTQGDDSYAARATQGGSVELNGTQATTEGAGATGLSAEGAGSSIAATDATILTSGRAAHGAQATDGASVAMQGGTVTVQGASAYALTAGGAGSRITTDGTTLEAKGVNGAGLQLRNRATAILRNTRVTASGTGVWSSLDTAGASNTISIEDGSQIDTQDGTALLATGANHSFSVSGATITARTGGSVDNGVLLRSDFLRSTSNGTTTDIDSEQVTLNAARSALSGDIVAASGRVDVSLTARSTLTGALVQRGSGKLNSMSLDSTSVWNMRGDSTLGTLANGGTVAFSAPAGGTDFKTLTVNHYVGGGTLVLNTQLGGDTSATDKLVIDGGSASGQTSLRILNAGGAGAQTQTGIRVIQTTNGGTTSADAFRLDAGSTGYRTSAGTLALNGYEYSLVRGGHGGVAPDWYLTSEPENARQPSKDASRNVSPESGAYLGNQLAAIRLFMHGPRDRASANAVGDGAAYGNNSVGPDGGGDDDFQTDASGRRLWTRVEGRRDSGLRMRQGRVDVGTNTTVLQLGGDLLKTPFGQGGAVYAGLMGGYGNARSTSTSAVILPTGATVQSRARGKVSGYSAGVYATAYQNDATRLGTYADSWLQYGRYSNQVDSELGSARYRSNVWSAALEAGYAVKPFNDGSVLGPVVIEPHAQLVYSRYKAQDATLQGTRMRGGNENALNSRAGVRIYPHATSKTPAVRPFLEANWLHRFNDASVRMGPNTLDAAPARNALELKLGAEGRIGANVQMSGTLFSQTGNNSQRGYGGMLNVAYRW